MLSPIEITEITIGSLSPRNGSTRDNAAAGVCKGDIVFAIKASSGFTFASPSGVTLILSGGLSFRSFENGLFGSGRISSPVPSNAPKYYSATLAGGSLNEDDTIIIVVKKDCFLTSLSTQRPGCMKICNLSLSTSEPVSAAREIYISIAGQLGCCAVTQESILVGVQT